MSNINDVAKRAKVSKATVSRYINNKHVSKELSTRIEKAITELNFTPNKIAQGLSMNQSDMIAVIVPDLLNPFFSELTTKIESNGEENLVTCLIFSSKGCIEKEKRAIKLAELFRVKGVIVVTVDNHVDLSEFKVPILALDRKIVSALKNIVIDNEDVGHKIFSYFESKNAKNILYIEGDSDLDTSYLRREGFIELAKKAKMNYTVLNTSYDDPEVVEQAIKSIEDIHSYDGIYMGNEIIAFSVLKQGIAEEVAKVTTDGTYLNKYLLQEVYTLKQPIDQLAKLAFEKINNWDGQEETITLSVKGE